VTADLNPCARLAAVLRARHVPDPEQVALLATDHLAAELATRYGYSDRSEWLTAAADLFRARLSDPCSTCPSPASPASSWCSSLPWW
jgi:hypothetical protein